MFKYGKELRFISQHFPLPQLTFAEHDVVLLTPTEVSDNVYNFLKSTLPIPFNVGRPLVLVEYTYNQADNLERYVFKWKLGEANSPFSNPLLREIMIEKAQPLKGFPKHFIPFKIRHVTCNDPVPPVYLLAFLWVEVFIKLLSEEQFEEWQQTSTATTLEIEIDVTGLVDKIRTEYATSIGVNDVRRAIEELVKIGKAKLISGEKYRINYSNLAGRVFEETEQDQQGLQKKLELREYGRVFATLLAKKELKPVAPARLSFGRKKKLRVDHPLLPFGE